MPLAAIPQTIPLIIDESQQFMSGRADVYIASGSFSAGEIPKTYAEFTALYTGATPKFKPFGEQQEEASTIEIDEESEKTHKRSRRKSFIIKTSLKIHNFSKDIIGFIESAAFNEPVSILIVQEDTPASAAALSADTPANFFALSGITLSFKGKLPTAGSMTAVEFTSEEKRKLLTNVIKMEQFTSAT